MPGFLDEPGVTYPQAVRIELEGAGPITISALELREEGPMRMMDHTSVFFRDEDVPRE